jgi:hypothetical protein
MDLHTLASLLTEIEAVARHAEAAGFPKLRTNLLAVAGASLMGLDADVTMALAPIVENATKRAEAWQELGVFSLTAEEEQRRHQGDGEEPA